MKIKNNLQGYSLILSIAGLPLLTLLIVAWRPFADASSTAADNTFKEQQIDLDKAAQVALPAPKEELRAATFKTPDGKDGWVIKIPGGRPIATPAYADGMIFIGGGYGSHEFYAFNAQTGALAWKAATSDDGPTAAVVEDGCVAFNTESCTVIVDEARTGKPMWQEWLGDPLMSQPAIYKGRLYIAHPAGQRGNQQAQLAKPGGGATGKSGPPRTSHRLLCADLKTGRHIWEADITADVLSAPVASDDRIYLTCFDGTSFCINADTGAVVWKKENSGTSAPIVAAGQVVTTQKENRGGKNYEGIKRVDTRQGEERDKTLLASSEAEYLGENKGGGVAMSASQTVALDSAVGFGSGAPQAAQMEKANKQLGVNSVAGAWAYQGSRAAYSKGQMMNAQGRFLNSMRISDGAFTWRAEVKGAGIGPEAQVFSPPALGMVSMYLCSSQGHIISVGQKDGAVGFIYAVKQPMAFQPALAQGNIYIGTANGLLICLKTGEKDADGWYSWGGNAQHNKNN